MTPLTKIGAYPVLGLRMLRSALGRLTHPYKLTFVVTKECHSRCTHCDIWKVKPHNELSLEEIRLFARQSPFLSWIDFTGGEPTDRHDLAEIVGAFLEHCPYLLLVHFPTNGLKTKRIVKTAADIAALRPGRLVVTVSIDGPPEINDQIRGIPGDFDRSVDTYQELSKVHGVETYIGLTLLRQNQDLLDLLVDTLSERIPGFTLSKLHVNLPHVAAHFYGNHQTPPAANQGMIKVVEEFSQRRGLPISPFALLERAYHRRVRPYLETGKHPQDCSSLYASCFLAQDGTIFPCSIWDAPLGNIRDHAYSMVPILESDLAAKRRTQLLAKDCPNCWTPCDAYPTIFANLFKAN